MSRENFVSVFLECCAVNERFRIAGIFMRLFRSLQSYFWRAFVHRLRKCFAADASDFVEGTEAGSHRLPVIVVRDETNETRKRAVRSNSFFSPRIRRYVRFRHDDPRGGSYFPLERLEHAFRRESC